MELMQTFQVTSSTDLDNLMRTMATTQPIQHSLIVFAASRFMVMQKLWHARQKEINMIMPDYWEVCEVEDKLDARCKLEAITQARLSEWVRQNSDRVTPEAKSLMLNDEELLDSVRRSILSVGVLVLPETRMGEIIDGVLDRLKPEAMNSVRNDEEYINQIRRLKLINPVVRAVPLEDK